MHGAMTLTCSTLEISTFTTPRGEVKYATSSAGKGIEQACFNKDVVNLNSRKGKTDGGSNGNNSNNDTIMSGDCIKAVG